MSKKNNIWKLDPNEVDWGTASHVSTLRKKLTRASRAVDKRGTTVTLRHMPTGLEVSGEIPEGHYSRKQMREAQQKIYLQLFSKLEKKVGNFLRIKGRS